ncbi:MAG: hypothetical protein PVI23_07055 [Maricaulaceae bacterium]|jgi:hypothetical protein
MKPETKLKAERALAMRRDGMTYKAIGEALGVSGSRASQLVWRQERMLEASARRQRARHAWRGEAPDIKLSDAGCTMLIANRLRRNADVETVQQLRAFAQNPEAVQSLDDGRTLGRKALTELKNFISSME